MKYDVIVIGGGPSGLMAAIGAGESGKKVLLIEKGNKLGRKLEISGGGRCNVTNRSPIDQLIKNIPGNGRFLYSAFTIFNNEHIIKFFEKLDVQLKEEDNGRMFPVSNDAKSVVNALVNKLSDLNVEILTNSPVKSIIYEEKRTKAVLLVDGTKITTNNIVVAVGGQSVPKTGSTGDGYEWAKQAGHTITTLFPTEVPITSSEPFIAERTLQGLSLKNVKLSVLNKRGRPIVTHQNDLIFTHFGLSGPVALRCSQFVVKQLQKKTNNDTVVMQLDVLPHINEEQLFQKFVKQINNDQAKSIKNCLRGILPERYLLFLLKESNINENEQAAHIPHDKIRKLAENCKRIQFTVDGTLSFDKAFVTGGGVSVKEIEPKTMASKLIKGLYFCGEIIDIHGYTGGFNITAALVTGRIAGVNAATNNED